MAQLAQTAVCRPTLLAAFPLPATQLHSDLSTDFCPKLSLNSLAVRSVRGQRKKEAWERA